MNNDGLWSGYNNAAINPTGMRMNNNGMNLNNGNGNMGALNLMNAPVYRITRVHGTQGINELRMAPDCEGLFADETAPIVQENNCPCNCVAAPTTIQVINPTEVGSTDAHYNMIVTKLC